MSANIILPRISEIGAGASRRVAAVMESLGVARPLIVTDPDMVRFGYVQAITDVLEGAGMTAGVFSESVPDPTVASVEAGLEALHAAPYDAVIGLGGGSPIDTAKAVAYLHVQGGRMRDYKAPVINDGATLPLIAIPTTAGTGSEATRFTIITDEATEEKMLCIGPAFCPVAALVDYELTLTTPPRLTADTGVDSLTHAIEAYVSRKRNPFADGMARLAMAAIARHLRTAYREPDNRPAREAMMLAAMQAGIAFSSASVCLVHGMSRPIGAFFHVPHGMSNAMLLPAVTAYSAEAAPERYADCARFMGVADAATPDRRAAELLIEELRNLNADLEVPSPEAYGIDRERYFQVLETMARQAEASGSPANNPKVPDQADMVALYRAIWDGN